MNLFRFLPLLILGTLLQAHSDRSGLHHWEIATPDPDRIFLSFHGDPATSRAVTWRTDQSVLDAFAQISKASNGPHFAESAQTVPATTESVDLTLSSRNVQKIVHFHAVTFEDLAPEALYAYRVGDGETNWSEWIQFRTASAEPKPFKFVYFGDAQNDIMSHWSRVIRAAYQKAPDAVIAVHAGDLVNRAHTDSEWAEWFKAGGFLHGQWTGIPVPGNHEYDRLDQKDEELETVLSLLWRPQFSLPVEPSLPDTLLETVYTVDYQGVQFLLLNSNRLVDEQIPYMEAQLRKPGALWRVAVFHHPIFSPAGERDNVEFRAKWKPVFDHFGVDLVLQGHDHTYARGHVPVKSGSGYESNTFQTLYITSVSGPKLYEIPEGKFERYASDGYVADRQLEDTQFFQVISIDGNKLTYEAYTATGALYDKAIIEKDAVTGRKRLE
jgi:hypothetical protein